MSNRAALVAVITAFAVGLMASLALRPAEGAGGSGAGAMLPQVRWRLPSAFGTHLPALGDNPPWVSTQLAEASGGRIRLDVFEPGALVPAFSIVDAVRDGKVDAGYTWLGYDQGKLPASVLFAAVPFGLPPWGFTAWWFEGGGRELALEIYAAIDVVPVLCGVIGPETAGWFRTELRGLADVRGLKIRFAGLGGKVLQTLGASVTMLPGGEIFQALEKGAIDATEYSLPVVDQRLGFDRVAQFNYFPGWHQPFTAFHLVVNRESWEALAATDRVLLEAVCTAGVTRNLARAEALQGAVLRGYETKGVRALTLPADVLAELRRVSEEVLSEESSRDADFARVIESQRRFEAEHTRWQRLAYLRPESQ